MLRAAGRTLKGDVHDELFNRTALYEHIEEFGH
jgi:hypothetical protein